MTIDEFEQRIHELLTYEDDDGRWHEESTDLFLAADGCLSCRFRGESVPCEGVPWGEALDIIAEHIGRAVADLPAGHWDV